jgi:beta-lactamase regulating signal transducer with metallopeptidase domain
MTQWMPIIERIGEWVVAWSWQAAVVLAVSWAAMLADRAHRPVYRCRVWTAGLLFVLFVPVAPALISSIHWSALVRQTYMPALEAPSMLPFVFDENFLAAETPFLQAEPEMQISLFHIIGILWLAGLALIAMRRLTDYSLLRRAISLSKPVRLGALTGPGTDWTWIGRPAPRLLLSRGVATPMLYGWLRPAVILPHNIREWSTVEERTAMIRHELAHLLRRDHWTSALESIVSGLLFFHPLVRFGWRQLRSERELACDRVVMKLGSDADCYAETILKVAERAVRNRTACAGIYFASAALLDRRIETLFQKDAWSTAGGLVTIPVAWMAAFLIVAGIIQTPVARLFPPDVAFSGPPSTTPVRSVQPVMAMLPRTLSRPEIQTRPAPVVDIRGLVYEGRMMNEAQVAALRARLRQNPDSLDDRIRMLGFHGRAPRRSGQQNRELQDSAVWMIQHYPEYALRIPATQLLPSDERYPEAKLLWTTHIASMDQDPVVFRNAHRYFGVFDPAMREQVLSKAESLWPRQVEWPRDLGQHYLQQATGVARMQAAAKAVDAFERALRVAREHRDRDSILGLLAEASLAAEMWDKAFYYASETARSNTPEAQHQGNWILGLMALQDNNVESAKTHLLASVPDRSYPSLAYAGPRLRLAVELLKRNERDAVVDYLQRWMPIWKEGQDRLRQWSILLNNGLTPDFGLSGR